MLSLAEIGEPLERATKTAGEFDRHRTVALTEASGIRLNPSLHSGRRATTTRNLLRASARPGERVVWAP